MSENNLRAAAEQAEGLFSLPSSQKRFFPYYIPSSPEYAYFLDEEDTLMEYLRAEGEGLADMSVSENQTKREAVISAFYDAKKQTTDGLLKRFPPHRLKQHANIMGNIHAEKPHSKMWRNSLLKVSVPSLFTKCFGRLMMIQGYVPMAGSASFGTFVLANLCYVAPPVAMIAGLVRFFIVLCEKRKKGADWSTALKAATHAFITSTFKFFVVYMAWTLGMALAASLSILSGGALPAGILVVAGITALGFMLASFITDILPDLKKKWVKFKAYFTSAFFEGSFWTLLDSLNLKNMMGGSGAGIEDVAIVTLVVSVAFFIGTFVYSCLSKLRDALTPITRVKNAWYVENSIKQLLSLNVRSQRVISSRSNKVAPMNIDRVEAVKELVKDARLKDVIEEYIKYKILFMACQKMLTQENGEYAAVVVKEASKVILAHKRSCRFFPLFFCRKARSLRMLEKAESLSKALSAQGCDEYQAKHISELKELEGAAKRRVEKAKGRMMRWGLFSTVARSSVEGDAPRELPVPAL